MNKKKIILGEAAVLCGHGTFTGLLIHCSAAKTRHKTALTHQICSLIFFPCNSTVLILKSIPVEEKTNTASAYAKIILEAASTSTKHEMNGTMED